MFTLFITEDEEKTKVKEGILYKTIIASLEKQLIEHMLERTEGNQLKAARFLGINRNTIRAKIKKLGIDVYKWKVS
jgi:DNA-binding protein Fis